MIDFETEDWISLILSIIIVPLGLIPILNQFKVINLVLPAFLDNTILLYIASVVGLYMIYIGYQESDTIFKHPTWALGALLFGLGLANVLGHLDIITFAGAATFGMIMNYVYVVFGLLLFFSIWTDKY